MRLTALLAACSLAAAMLVGCGDNSATTTGPAATGAAAGSARKLRIAVVPKGTTSPYWKAVHAGAQKAADELASTQPIEIVWKGSLREDQSAEEISVVEDMFNLHVDAIVLAPNNADALAGVVDEASQKKIPVVIIDSAVSSNKYTSFVATDNKKGGYMGGKELAKDLGGKGKVIMLRYQEGSASTGEREQGALDALKESAGIELVDVNKYGGATQDECTKAAENLLAAYKNPDGTLSIDGIFCPNLTTTYGMLLVLQDMKAAGKVKFVGFDSSPDLVSALKSGQINGLVVQNPIKMGYLGLKTAVEAADGKTVERSIDTGATLVTKENMNDPASQEVLDPPVDKYLKE
ncbi:MAG TPA: substrate-binding domain-containing protein [Phycisphaerae bacterium]|nr:substrate-binding domain-containing protein [Phycisphaerae bacterium]